MNRRIFGSFLALYTPYPTYTPFPPTPTRRPTATPTARPTLTPTPIIARAKPTGQAFATQLAGRVGGDFRTGFQVSETLWHRRVAWATDAKLNYQGGIVHLAGRPDGMSPFFVDDALRLSVIRPDGSMRTIYFDASASGELREIGPFDLTAYFLPGTNIIYVEIIDLWYSAWSTNGLWLVEFR